MAFDSKISLDATDLGEILTTLFRQRDLLGEEERIVCSFSIVPISTSLAHILKMSVTDYFTKERFVDAGLRAKTIQIKAINGCLNCDIHTVEDLVRFGRERFSKWRGHYGPGPKTIGAIRLLLERDGIKGF